MPSCLTQYSYYIEKKKSCNFFVFLSSPGCSSLDLSISVFRCLQGENRLDDTKSSQHITQVSTTRVHERVRKNLGRQLRPRMGGGGGDERPTLPIFDCDDEIIGCQTSGVRLSIYTPPRWWVLSWYEIFLDRSTLSMATQSLSPYIPSEIERGRCRYKQKEKKRKKKGIWTKKKRIYVYTRDEGARGFKCGRRRP